MAMDFAAYRFDEITQAPNGPGLYAWYHQLRISRSDVNELTEHLRAQDESAHASLIDRFIMDHIINPYKESDYEVTVKGPLKPEYRGEIPHRPTSSDLLVSLASRNPDALLSIGKLLSRAIPVFASPIYIGIAKTSLRARLSQHARLLSQYREMGPQNHPSPEDVDHSFAYDAVVVRRLIPSDLLVYTMPVDFPKEVAQATEYLLNRLNYPLCGRN